jgi:hypothetical protein
LEAASVSSQQSEQSEGKKPESNKECELIEKRKSWGGEKVF